MTGLKLIAWYEKNKRDLPWRDTNNPYLIWVSEIILQQTRVMQGFDYYRRFIEAWPNIFSLANASIDDVLKIWQGLGYYSRARNMHAAAKHIVDTCGGQFPATSQELLTIKGIGSYTAAAIASFAFAQAVPVIDGNVNRVIARLHGIQHAVNKPAGQKEIRARASEMMIRTAPAIYNQAIMEFGALQCVPQNPDCNACILNQTCVAFKSGLVHMLPVKIKTAKIATRHFHYLHIRCADATYIRKRAEGDIWTGLYEFPLIETAETADLNTLCRAPAWQSYFSRQIPTILRISPEITHRLTHRILKIKFYEISVTLPIGGENIIEIPAHHIYMYAVPIVIDNYLKSSHA